MLTHDDPRSMHLRALAALLLVASLGALGVDAASAAVPLWSVTTEPEAPQPISPRSLRPLPNGRVLMLGEDAMRAPVVVLLDAELDVLEQRRTSLIGHTPVAHAGDESVAALPYSTDGLYAQDPARLCVNTPAFGLQVRTFDSQILNGTFGGSELPRFALDRDGGFYGVYTTEQGSGIARFAPDCRRELLPNRHFGHPQAIPNDRAVYAVEYAGQEPRADSLVRLAGEQTVWIYRPDPGRQPAVSLFATARNGDALLRVQYSVPQPVGAVERIAADGAVRWSHATAPGRAVRELIDDRGETVVVEGALAGGQVDRLALLNASGVLRSEVSFPPAYYTGVLGDAGSNSAPVIRLQETHDPAGGVRLARLTSTGLAPPVSLPAGIFPWMQQDDASYLAVDLSATPRRVQRRGVDNSVLLDRAYQLATPPRVGGILADGGDVFFAALSGDGTTRLYAYSESGALRWTSALPEASALANYTRFGTPVQYRLAANATHVCLWRIHPAVARGALSCVTRDAGTQAFDWVALPAPRGKRAALALHGDRLHAIGGGCLVDAPSGTGLCRSRTERVVLALDGRVLERGEVGLGETEFVAAADARAHALQEFSGGRRTVSVHAADGTLRWRAELPERVGLLALSDDGYLAAGEFGSLVLFAPDGRRVWQRDLAPTQTGIDEAEFLATGDLLVSGQRDALERYRARIRRDGVAIWEWREPRPASRYGFELQTGIAEAANLYVQRITDYDAGPRWVAYRLSDGLAIGGHGAAPSGLPGLEVADSQAVLALEPDGDLVLASARPQAADVRVEKFARDSYVASAAPVAAELLGLWYAPDTTGQGFFLDHDATSSTTFGAWFTYEGSGGHDASKLRWYTFASTATTGAAVVEFELLRNRDGRFAQPPATSAERVGRATLRRIGCAAALLVYRFDAPVEQGASGAVPLVRLTPAADCNSTGSDATAARLRRARSGAWFVPEQSGQGLVFEFQPPRAGQPGHVAGAWFTYDAVPDDATRQHWFTLSGPAATDDSASLTLYRTLGGALDGGPTHHTRPIGTATLRFVGCDQARLEYQFEDAETAHDHRGLAGTLELRRIGGCGP